MTKDPTCDARQPDCPWPDITPGESVNDIRAVTEFAASRIIDTRVPRGKFFCSVDGTDYYRRIFIAIDNSTGEAWTEEFETLDACLEWLNNPRAEVAG
jgi:hypothetical protein